MNSDRPRFIDRDYELDRIADHATAWGTLRILIVDGPGGVGKTWLLEEAYRRRQEYIDALNGKLQVTHVINLDDISFHVPMNLGRRIAQEVDPSGFQEYFEQTDDLTLLEGAGLLTPERFERLMHQGDNLFLQAYNGLAERERIFLILDTVEAVVAAPIGRYFVKMASLLENTFLLIAGREGEQARQMFIQALEMVSRSSEDSLDYLLLENFRPKTALVYIDQTPVKHYLEAQPRLRDNLLLLTEGHPLSLALAVEWLQREMPLPDLVERTPDALTALPTEEMKQLRQQFERALVSYIRNLRIDVADLILAMAHFNMRFNAEILSAVMDLPLEESQHKIRSMKEWFFVKEKPDNILVLHDEMQLLIEQYVWPQVDPFHTRRKQLSQKAVSYYVEALRQIEQAIEALEGTIRMAEEREEVSQAAEARRTYLKKRRERWLLIRELLHYALDVNLEEGYILFVEEFDKASDQYQPLLRLGLVQEIAQHRSKFSGDRRYEIDIRIAKDLLDETEYQSAYELLMDLKEAFTYQDGRTVDILIQLANVTIRLGNLLEGKQFFKDALQACQDYQIADEKWWVMAENGLGWSCRLLGQWDEAIQHWHSALEYSSRAKDRKRMAMILNNLGNAYHLKGDDHSGLMLSLQGLEIAESVSGMRRQIAANHSTLGEIYLALGQYEKALTHYERALAIFEEGMDEEWIAIVCHQISRAKRHQAFDEGEPQRRQEWLDEALEYARRSVQLCEQHHLFKDAPSIYYGAGIILLDMGQVEEAEEYLEKSYWLNVERKEAFGLIVDSVALAEIAYLRKRYQEVERIAEESEELVGDRAEYPLFYGRLLRTLAQAQLDQGKYDEALATYVEALTRIARHGGYGKYRTGREVALLRKRVEDLPDEIRESWSNRFIEEWESDPDRASTAPEVKTTLVLARSGMIQPA